MLQSQSGLATFRDAITLAGAVAQFINFAVGGGGGVFSVLFIYLFIIIFHPLAATSTRWPLRFCFCNGRSVV